MMVESFQPEVREFSAAYNVFWNATLVEWGSHEAAMEQRSYQFLDKMVTGPVVAKVGGLNYYMKPEAAMPAGCVAVPAENHDNPGAVLIQK